jgi:hypothetical protein
MIDIQIIDNDIVIQDDDILLTDDKSEIFLHVIETVLKTHIRKDIISIYELGSEIKDSIIQAKNLSEIRDSIKSELEHTIKEINKISLTINNDIILLKIVFREDSNEYEIRVNKREII